MSKPILLSGKEKNQARAKLRKALKEGQLLARRTFYDYYDSCHAPTETPNAPFEEASRWIKEQDLKQGGYTLALKDDGIYEAFSSYCNYEIKFKS